jgi:hypothetical protein
VVSVTVLRRSVAVEIERQWIQPAELRGHAAPAVTYPVADPNSVLHDQTRPC